MKFVPVRRYLDILEHLPLQHTPGILKSLVVVSVVALAITFERSHMPRGEQFSKIRNLLYRHLLLGVKSLIMYSLLLKTSVMYIEILMESLLIGYVNCMYLLIFAVLT
jgi:hypothetical protein